MAVTTRCVDLSLVHSICLMLSTPHTHQITSFESAQKFIDKLDADDKKFVEYPVRTTYHLHTESWDNTLNTLPHRARTMNCSTSLTA